MGISASVAIPTYERSSCLIEAMQSAVAQRTDFDYEVMVLDNGCESDLQAETECIAKQATVSVRYIPIPEIGLHNGRNKAALLASSSILVYVDDDVIAPKDWLAAMCAPFKDPNVGGVAGKSVPYIEGSRPGWIDAVPPSYFSLLDLGPHTHEIHWPQTPYGCNMAFRRDVVLELKGFSPDAMGKNAIEWLRGDGETGFAQKVYAAGYKIIYTAEGWLYHKIPQERMTLKYVRRRAMKSGISSFYRQMRTHRYTSLALMRMGLMNLTRFTTARIRNELSQAPMSADWVRRELQTVALGTIGIYQLRLALDPGLRKWVNREHYMSRDSDNHAW